MHLPRNAFAALTGVLATATVTIAVGVVAAPPASAEEVYATPSNGVFAIEGHGWGHGHGMSQWGAQGGASLGRTSDQITSFYYPGTAKTVLANSTMRVRLLADTGGDTQVFPSSGLAVGDRATGVKAVLPTGPTRWRAVVDAAGLHVQQLVSGAWKPWALGGKTVHAGPLEFSGSTFLRVLFPDGSSRDYRGTMRSVKLSSTSVATVNALPMESYLMGVVPRESSSSWQAAALQSQSIAARSYSAYKRAHAPSSALSDICDTTQCQVYGGAAIYSASGTRTSLEPATTTNAIRATAGVVRTYGGAAIFSEYSSSNGGWSTDGGVPYMKAQADGWDGVMRNSVHSWTATLTAAQVQRRYPAVGTLKRIRVTRRDGNGEWGGRVKEVVLEGVNSSGSPTSVSTTGAGVYNAHTWPASSDGLRSSWWHIAASTGSAVIAQSAAPALVRSPGVSTGTLTVSLKNTGTTTWSNTGLHLAVASPPGQADPLVGGSTKPGVFTRNQTHPGATTVVPGDVVDFRFALTGDGVSPGSHGRSYRLRNGTGGLFGTTVSWVVPVAAPRYTAARAAKPIGLAARPAGAPADAPNAVFADGRTVVVPVNGSTAVRLAAKNTGNFTWPVTATTPVVLGTSDPRDRVSPSAGSTWLSSSRVSRLKAAAAVTPGQAGTFDLTLNGAGRAAGVTTEVFEPLWDGRHWLDGTPTALDVVRVDPSRSRLASTAAAPPASVALTNAPTGITVLRVRLRNLGGSAWEVGKEALSANATALSTSAWPTTTTPPPLTASVTRPGQVRVYPGEVGEWRVPLSAFRDAAGTYSLALRAKGPDGAVYGPRFITRVTVAKAVFSGSLVRVIPSRTVPSAGTTNAWFEVKNTGNVAWPVGGAVRSVSLTRGGSPSAAANWLSSSRPGPIRSNVTVPGSTSVEPGQVARFVITLAGNGRSPGARSESFGVLWESWLRMAGLSATLTYTIT